MTRNLSYNLGGSSDESMPLPGDEAGCVELARKGNGLAFAWLFQHYNAPICTYIARLVGNDELGRDLAQETFVRAWKSLPGLSGELLFKPWLYRIATNVTRSHQRHERLVSWLPLPRPEQVYTAHRPLSVEGPEELIGEREQVHQILGCLGAQARACLLLQLHAGFSQREIATVLKISEKSVSSYVSRGREQFRQLYNQARGDSPQ